MKRILPSGLSAILLLAPWLALPLRAGAVLEGDTADAMVTSSKLNDPEYGTAETLGVGEIYNQDVGTIVEPFELPYLAPGQTVTNAAISFYLASINPPVTATVQLYGLTRVSATNSSSLTSDWYVGSNDTANTLLDATFATPGTPAGTTVTYSGANLVSFIQRQYANPAFAKLLAGGTRYIFFRLSPNLAQNAFFNYQFATSRNLNRAFHPMLALTLSGGISNQAGRLQFSFNLPRQAITSAGVYNAGTGALIRTLWNNVQYAAGTNYGAWDGTDDSGNAVATGTSYQIKLIYHNVQYTWDGVVGNTSAAQSGLNVYRSFTGIRDIVIGGGKAFYAVGYNELQNPFHYFAIGSPQAPSQIQPGFSDCYSNFVCVAADASRSYWAKGTGGISSSDTYVIAINNSDGSLYTFPKGSAVTGSNQSYQSCVDFDATANQPNPATGLAVQASGSALFVSHANLNVVRVFDKVQGNSLGSFSVAAPGHLAVTANGDVWVISNAATPVVTRYTFANGDATVKATLTGLANPLNVAVSADDSLVLVADGGASNQVKAFNNATGAPVWTFGTPGGMPKAGPAINNSTFDFSTYTALAFQPDNTFWVGDTGSGRVLHFSLGDSGPGYIEQIAYIPTSYLATVDVTDAKRVFNGFYEYSVNYAVPAGGTNGSWTMTHNWLYGLPNDSQHHYQGPSTGFNGGWSSVATLSNGRTYGLMMNQATERMDLFELPPSGPARDTGYTFDAIPSLYPDGSLRFNVSTSSSIAFYSAPLTGFDAAGNPKWGSPALLASSRVGRGDPGTWDAFPERTELTAGGMVIDFDGNHLHTGYHLGAIARGGTSWIWRASPSTPENYTGFFPQDGRFDVGNGVQYAGNVGMSAGRNIVYGYHGEMWKNGQASQWVNFFDDGLMVGRFGTYGFDVPAQAAADGFTGNCFSPEIVRAANGNVYLYTNDESNHSGSCRWKITGWDKITELSGTAAFGTTVALSGPTGPSVTITSPTPNAAFYNSPSLMVTAEAAGSGSPIARVEFFDGATSLGSATVAPYTVTTGVLAAGTHTLTAVATDRAGRSATSPAATVTVGNGSAGGIISFQAASAGDSMALVRKQVAGAPGYAVANFNILGQNSTQGLIFVSPVDSAGATIRNLGLNVQMVGSGPGGSLDGLPGTALKLFSGQITTTFSRYPALSVEFVPYAQYDLVVYSLSAGGSAHVTVGDTISRSTVSQRFTRVPTGYAVANVNYGAGASVTDINTIVFRGMTAMNFQLQGDHIAGFQIVERR
ncbi:MAG: Ig-like domain-containing protein [Verrucomicrobiota bacterium]